MKTTKTLKKGKTHKIDKKKGNILKRRNKKVRARNNVFIWINKNRLKILQIKFRKV